MSSDPYTRPVDKRALSINEFCAAYGLSRSTTYKLIAQGALSSVLIGGRRLIPVESAEALLKKAV